MKKSYKKAQAALEFLMTYGWAILVVLVAIGALAYFGVLSPDKFLPDRCTLPAGIACEEHKIVSGAGNSQIALRNSLGTNMKNVVVSIAGCGDNSAAPVALIANGAEPALVNIDCDPNLPNAGVKFSGDISVTYDTDTIAGKKLTGTITTKVQ